MSEAREWGDSRHERLSEEDQTDRSARESTGGIEIRRPGRGKKSGHRGASNPEIVLIDGDSANPHLGPPSRGVAIKRTSRYFAAADGLPPRRCGELDFACARKRQEGFRLRQSRHPQPGREPATQIGQLHRKVAGSW